MAIKLINKPFYQGMKVTVELDGKEYTRKVYCDKIAGLYIVIKNTKYFEYELDYTEYYKKRGIK